MGDSSERREGNAMSRWLWALLAGVVLVAIAAVFWIDDRRVSYPRFRAATTAVAPAPRSRLLLRRTPRPRLRPHLRPRPRRRRQPRPLRPPAPLRRPMQDSKPPRRPLRPRRPREARGSPSRRAGAFAPACSRSARRNAPAAARARTGGAGSRERICAQEPRAAGRDLGLFRGGLRAPLPAARRRLGLSAAGGQVRPGRDRRVAEENPSAFRHLPDRGRIGSGRHAQGKRRLRGLD